MKTKNLYSILLAMLVSIVIGPMAAAEKPKPSGHEVNSTKENPTTHKDNHESDKEHTKNGNEKKHAPHSDDKDQHDEDEGNKALVRLNDASLKEAGLSVEALMPKPVANAFMVPGETKANAYDSALITPRINSIVISRQAFLGDQVKRGEVLVTLFSVEMSSAQSKFIISDREWQRVRRLGEDVVSARRFLEAKVKRQEDYARLKAYGMTDVQIGALGEESALNKPQCFLLLIPFLLFIFVQ